MEWATDDYVVVKGHDTQEEPSHVDESDEEVDLGHTLHLRDGLAAHYVIHQYLGDSEKQMSIPERLSRKKYMCVETRFTADSQIDEKFPGDSDQIHPLEKPKENLFLI
jgi:hypothetical protein